MKVEMTAWLRRSAYDFYARVLKDCQTNKLAQRTSGLAIFHNKCIIKSYKRANHVVICLCHTYREYFDSESLSKTNIELLKQIHTVYFFVIWLK